MLARPDTDVEITIEGGHRNYEVYNTLNSLLISGSCDRASLTI